MNNAAAHHAPTSEEIALLRASVRDSLNSLGAGSAGEQWPHAWAASWDTLTQQGLWSTIEPPEGSVAMAAVVVEELGRALYPGPACETLAATYVFSRLGDSAVMAATGGASSAVAFASEESPMVQVAPDTRLIVATGRGDLAVVSAADTDSCAVASLDVTRRITELRLRDQPETAVSSPDMELAISGRTVTALLYCADTLGCVEQVLERTAEYASQRMTFGSPIGKYQAVAHRLVDHAVTAQQMRLLLDVATATFDREESDVLRHAATAETFFYRRSSAIISDCIQLAGAIGFTWEFGHHFYLRRAVQNMSLGGGHRRPQQRLAQVMQW
jgi:alkylation response protein AidB-like acyl-CoA dehydrogenase